MARQGRGHALPVGTTDHVALRGAAALARVAIDPALGLADTVGTGEPRPVLVPR